MVSGASSELVHPTALVTVALDTMSALGYCLVLTLILKNVCRTCSSCCQRDADTCDAQLGFSLWLCDWAQTAKSVPQLMSVNLLQITNLLFSLCQQTFPQN